MTDKEAHVKKLAQEIEALQENEAKLQALMHSLPVGISILSRDGKPIYTNPALERILGLSEESLLKGKYRQRRYLRADGSEMPGEEFPSAVAFREHQAVRNVEIGIITENDETIWTMVSAVPFERGEWQVLLTVADITRQKDAENALQKRTEELVERIKDLNCLYGISRLVERPGITLEEILQGTADLLPSSARFPELTCAQIIYEGKKYASTGFKTSEWKQSSDIYVNAHPAGSVEVCFIGNKSEEGGKSAFLEEDQTLLHAVSERLGHIIERFQAAQLLVKLATTDPLTGLYNRRHFFDLAQMEIDRSRRYGRPLACILFDIDYFKQINDSYGHLFGDKVLQTVVWRCREMIRRVDIFARYGGDEFVILLPETGMRRSQQLADRLCTGFQDLPLNISNKDIQITLSLGLAGIKGNDDLALDILLTRADKALYNAKAKGRNRVSVWRESK